MDNVEKQQMLDMLRRARAVLDRGYCKNMIEDLLGNHCAYGALIACDDSVSHYKALDALVFLDTFTRVLHPEYGGRMYCTIHLNNETDKETTLAVFNAAILDLEIKL